MAIRVKNWSDFQHYKNRNPPWIKLHRRLLDDLSFSELDGDSSKTLIMLWMLAAETKDGSLPTIKEIAFRLRIASNVLVEHISKLNQWLIIDDSDMLATCERSACSETETETETERETETEHAHTRATCSKNKIEEEFDLFWEAYPKKVGKKNAFKAFQKARKTDLPEIGVLVPIIEKQKLTTQWRRDNGQFIPNPSTWLNQGRWDDEQQSVDSKPLSKAEQIHQQNMVVLQKYIGGDTNGYNRGHRETTCEAITVVPRKNNR